MIRKVPLILFLLIMIISMVQASSPGNSGYPCSSYITISGKTNINNFNLSHSPEKISPFLLTSTAEAGTSFPLYHTMEIPVKQFKADNPLMYKDFLRLVKASDYPHITIRFPEKIPGKDNNKYLSIDITIAGTTQSYNISCISVQCDKETAFLYGTQEILLTDFNIEPPEKTFGFIKVKNEVIINFGFALSVH